MKARKRGANDNDQPKARKCIFGRCRRRATAFVDAGFPGGDVVWVWTCADHVLEARHGKPPLLAVIDGGAS